MRRPIIVGNWKMNMFISTADEWIRRLLSKPHLTDSADIIIAPPFTALAVLRDQIKGSRIKLAGQNIGPEPGGSLTGEISAAMLRDAGCDYVILGHNERRQFLTETDEIIRRKVIVACDQGLNIIFCIGESLDVRNNCRTNELIEAQLSSALLEFQAMELSRLVIAYEPVWAIGTGHNASPVQTQEVHLFIRAGFERLFGTKNAKAIRIVYGGSVKPETSASLMNKSDVDGLLVGGASLNPNSFYDIINSLL